MKVAILPQASRDLFEGFCFYEDQKLGLGARFHQALSAAIDSWHHTAGIHRKLGGYHRLLVRPFPYAVYHRVVANACYVDAVIDCRRGPGWIRSRLRRS